MFIKFVAPSAFGLLVAMPALAAGHVQVHAPVPPASFLNYHVSTLHELSQEVTLDPAVRARLANHFHITQTQLMRYVQRNLVLTHLQKGGRYRVACVGRDGREFWIESRLPKGTAVFASRATGRPILKLACGNPMVSSLPPTIQTAGDIASAGPAQFAFLPPPALADSPPMPGLLTGDIAPTDLAIVSTALTPAVVQVSPSLETLIPGTLLNAGSRSFNALPALLGALAVGVASTGHGGSSPNAVAPPAVPEASTPVSLGSMLLMGGVGLFILRRKQTSVRAK